jgi:nucleoside-diphosphate-sugar epimerase
VEKKNMLILLTGANGFLGRECGDELSRRGHNVLRTDRHGVVDYLGDLADENFCASLPPVDVVVHSAAVQYVSKDLPLVSRNLYFQRNNVQATARLAARYTGRLRMIVNIGTSMMYEQVGLETYCTTSRMNGQGVYSKSKLEAQAYIDAMPNAKATVIPCIIGGIGREGLFRSFVGMMKTHGVVVFPGLGRHKVGMVHVKDVASLVGQIVDGNAEGRFNAAAPNPLSIEEWIVEIEGELGLRPVRRLRLPLAPIHALSALTGYRMLAREQLLMLAQSHVLDVKESLAVGWRPKYDNARIVRDIARHVATID